ncbi:MAG: ATP-grasp domain-containing protein [Alphaproteobacteria bacterium]|nr:ATP-grasp domain-containing protein [Alphaproteobacteria bacterium]
MRVALLHERLSGDARTDEKDALVQRDELAAALRRLGHETVFADLDLDLATATRRLRELAPDVVFNLVEAVGGQARLVDVVPGLLDGLGLPFTGNGQVAMFLTSHKRVAKERLGALGLPTPALLGDGPRVGRWIVKPVWEDASVGIDDGAVVDADQVDRALRERGAVYGEVFAEAYVEGRELNLSLLADGDSVVCLPPAEIAFEGFPEGKPRIVGYAAKWDEGSFEYARTPRTLDFPDDDAPLLRRVADLAVRCWYGFGLTGYARVDFRVDRDGQPFVLEVNANPCLASDAGFMAASARAGLGVDAVVARLLDDALTRARKV